jgi:hypothetical protein
LREVEVNVKRRSGRLHRVQEHIAVSHRTTEGGFHGEHSHRWCGGPDCRLVVDLFKALVKVSSLQPSHVGTQTPGDWRLASPALILHMLQEGMQLKDQATPNARLSLSLPTLA